MYRIGINGRWPAVHCSVCKWEPFAVECTCPPAKLLRRRDITIAEAYLMIGVRPPPPGGFTVPEEAREAPPQRLIVRIHNALCAFKYAWHWGHSCTHAWRTRWYMLDMGARQSRWCRACGHTEYR